MNPSTADQSFDPHATALPPTRDIYDTIPGGSPPPTSSFDTTVPYSGSQHATSSKSPQIGRYEILGEIARGGMGVVYQAFDPQLDRVVALKLIKSGGLADTDQIERFQTEAKAAAQLDHPGIVPVYEVGEFGGQHFLTMAFVDGHSLWQEVKESPLAPKRAAKLMQQVAEAIQFAHDRGIVHRDLKPQNILLTKDGQPKVTDFGLAKRSEHDVSLTQTGQALGTPSYMPPEQAQGKVKDIGPLADVYSLGATLYCLLTGRPPFQAATQLETMLQVVEQEPVSPKSLNRAVSVDLETICLRCLEKDSAKRYATAGALADDLNRYLTGEPIQARPVGRLERVLKWIARKPVTAAAYGLTALTAVLTVVGLTITMFWRSAEIARGEAEIARNQAVAAGQQTEVALKAEEAAREQTETALRGESEARAGEEAARKELEVTKAYSQYVLNVRLAPTLWENGWVTSARQALEDCPLHLRQWEWHYLNRKLHPELATMSGYTRPIKEMKSSPEGQFLATSREAVHIWDATTGRQVALIDELGGARTLAFSPDGRQLVMGTDPTSTFSTRSAVLIWDMVGQRRITLFEQPHRVLKVAYRSDGKRLAAGLGDGTVRIWNTEDFSEIPLMAKHSNGAALLSFHSNGKGLLTGGWDGIVKLWDSDTGREVWTSEAEKSLMVALRGSSDGKDVVTAFRGGLVKRWNVETQQETASFQENFALDDCAISPDLRRTATRRIQVFIRDTQSGKLLRELQGNRGISISAVFSPDNQTLATGWSDGFIRTWDIVSGELLSTLTGHLSGVTILEFSPDGSRLYSGDNHGVVMAWDLADQSDVVEFTVPTESPVAAISSDGRRGAFVVNGKLIRVRDLTTKADIAEWSEAPQEILQLAFSPDSQTLASGGTDGIIRLRSFSDPAETVTLTGHAGRVNHLEFSPDGKLLATAGDDHTARLWNLTQRTEQTLLRGHADKVMKAVFKSRGDRLATYSFDNTVRLWNATTGEELRKFTWEYPIHHNHSGLLLFSPDGLKLASTHGIHWRIWDTTTGSEIARREESGRLISIEFSPDSRLLVYGGWMTQLTSHVWDIPNQHEVAQCPGEHTALKFTPDGKRLIAAGEDQTIRMWDTTTWQEMATLTGHKFKPFLLQFDAQGQNLLSASHDGTIRRWMTEESSEERAEQLSIRPRIWRLGELKRAEQSENWYAAAFHLGWLINEQPQDESLKTRYDQALAKLKEQNISPPPRP